MNKRNNQKIEGLLESKVEIIIEKESIKRKLKSGRILRIKFGADPSTPDLHLGHWVVLKKLKEFQDLGHKIIFIIGDFTARIGDPSGRVKARPAMTEKEIKKNARTYFNQVGKVLDLNKTEIRYNSEWFGKMKLADILKLMGLVTVNQILERDDFNRRYKENQPIGLHEFVYPLMQAYDSVYLKADIEIGGSDQLFNLLMGRTLQEKFNQVPQDIITCPLLVGIDGVQKMSKSLGNYVAFNDSPKEMFGKLMSIPDSIIIHYYKLLTDLSEKEILDIEQKMEKGENPRDFKTQLAKIVVAKFYNQKEADNAEKEFNRVFRAKQPPEKIPEFKIKAGEYNVLDLLTRTKLVSSKGEARRLVEQGGIKINNKKIEDWAIKIKIKEPLIIKAGKRRFLKIVAQI